MPAPMESTDADRTTRLALAFEGALGVSAIVIGWLVGQWPLVGVSFADEEARRQVMAVGLGLVATGPLLVVLFLCERFPVGPLQQVQEMTASVVLRMFGGATTGQLLVVSLAAGIGEELLFRGLVQSGAARLFSDWPGQVIALILASALFG